MKNHFKAQSIDRREFLSKGLMTCSAICLGCSLSHLSVKGQVPQKTFNEKMTEKSEMSFEQVFNFAFRDLVIPALMGVSEFIGQNELVNMIKKANDKIWIKKEMQTQFGKDISADFWSHVLEIEVLENTDKTRIQRVTKCLWAKTFREAGASELGYALWCYPDYAMAKSDKMKLERPKTLMLGDDQCYFKYTKEI